MSYSAVWISCFDSYQNRRVNFLLPQWGGGGKMCAGGVHSGGHLKYYINWWENCQGAHGHSYFRISRFSRFWGPFPPPGGPPRNFEVFFCENPPVFMQIRSHPTVRRSAYLYAKHISAYTLLIFRPIYSAT